MVNKLVEDEMWIVECGAPGGCRYREGCTFSSPPYAHKKSGNNPEKDSFLREGKATTIWEGQKSTRTHFFYVHYGIKASLWDGDGQLGKP